MHPNLKQFITIVGTISILGVTYKLASPHPSTVTVGMMRDAGLNDGQRAVLVRIEKLTQKARNRINNAQPGALRPKQVYATIARQVRCFRADGVTPGNCFDPQGVPLPPSADGIFVVTSQKFEDGGIPVDDEDGESNDGDNNEQVGDGQIIMCNDFDAGQPSPFATPFCNRNNRMMVVPSACMMPNCWIGPDNAWVDDAVVDCKAGGPWAVDNQPTWRGCNRIPGEYAVGTQCVPVACSVNAGDNPPDYL